MKNNGFSQSRVLSEKIFIATFIYSFLLFLFESKAKNCFIEWWFCGQVNLKPAHEIEAISKKLTWGQAV